MKITATILSVAALTMLSGAALAYPVLPPMKGAPIESAAMTMSQTPPSKHVAQPTVTALQQCKILEHRFDNTAASVALKSTETTQGALRAEGGQLCQSHPHAGARYLRAAIAVLNAKLGAGGHLSTT